MLRFTILFMLAMTNNTQEVTMINNIKTIKYITESSLYTHKYGHEFKKEWYKEI